MHTNSHTHPDQPRVYAPFMVVNPGERLDQAIARHKRETGHRGGVVVVAFNRASAIAGQVAAAA